ncbi:MAG: DUF4383 domain-containing protein [Micrococcales bacterium]|nr:DUF4383 domain-containing protein [Micrococcales bacterium]
MAREAALARSPNRLAALIAGAAFLAIGALGFAASGGSGFVSTTGGLLFGVLPVNGLQNLVHLLLGGALVTAALVFRASARTTNQVIGTLFLALGIAGLFLAGTPANVLAVGAVGNLLHFSAAVVLLAVGLGVEGRPSDEVGPARATPSRPGSG